MIAAPILAMPTEAAADIGIKFMLMKEAPTPMTGIRQNPKIPKVKVAKVGDPDTSPPTKGK